MSLPGLLCQFGLKQLFDVSSSEVTKWVDSRFEDASRAVVGVVIAANRRAWDVLDAALAPPTFVGRLRGRLKEADFRAARDEVQKLAGALPADVRERAAQQLVALGSANPFAAQLDAAEAVLKRFAEPAALAAELDRAAAAVSDALAAHAPDLAAVLGLTSDGRTPLFQTLYRYYFRKLTAKNAELAGLLQDDRLRALADLTDTRTAGVLDQLNVLFDSLDEQFASVNAKLEAGFAGIDAKLDDIQRRLLKPGVTYATDEERAYLQRAKERFRRNPNASAAEWAKLGDAMSVARMYPEAAEVHEAAAATAHATRDTATEAANHYKAYLDACEAGAWPRAFELLLKAIALEPVQYRPFDYRRYQPQRILGGGAFGTVFLCHDLYDRDEADNPRSVAIKALRADALDRDLTKVFAEARTLKALAHPSIIGVIDQGFGDPEAQTRPYLILEYFAGQTLDQLGKLALPDFFPIARRLAEAVHAAHSRPRPIYHRDLKPSNIMVRRNANGAWEVKVIDFGLALRAAVARAADRASRSTTDRSVAGTLKYAPPEQTGDLPNVEVGAHSDVYAFGKTCLDVLFHTTAPKMWDWDAVPADVRAPLQELLERCTADPLAHRHKSFEPVLKVLTELDPAQKAERARQARDEAIRLAAKQQAERELAERTRAEEVARQEAEKQRRAEAVVERKAEELARQRRERAECESARATESAQRSAVRPPERNATRTFPAIGILVGVCLLLVTLSVVIYQSSGEKKYPPGDVYTLRVGQPAVEMAFYWIPRGSFQMGGTGYGDEKPAHKVTISKGFRMGQTEVTQAQWKAVMGSESPSHFKGPERPVDSVTWDESQQFCQKLQDFLRKGGMSGVTVRLPTEAEWEYACRAGTTFDYWSGSDEAALRRAGWFTDYSKNQTQPVGKLAKNAWGLHDVHGNVWEWCHDDMRPYTAQEQVDPIGRSNDNSRALRGGSWRSTPDLCRAACRRRDEPATRHNGYGFRVCFRLN
jgi:formylglycine-generating enzyme required for sulfatase activity